MLDGEYNEEDGGILTRSKIFEEAAAGRIVIDPFNEKQLNPNSYNFRLGPILGVPIIENGRMEGFRYIEIPKKGYVLKPHTMYLGNTMEKLGSNTYAMRLIGRSSGCRLSVMVEVNAELGHTGSCHQWTLEMVPAMRVRLYAGMPIGQIMFWKNEGEIGHPYEGGYSAHNRPTASKMSFG